MINTNLHHRFEVIADYCSNFGRKTATMVIEHRRLASRILLSVTKSKCYGSCGKNYSSLTTIVARWQQYTLYRPTLSIATVDSHCEFLPEGPIVRTVSWSRRLRNSIAVNRGKVMLLRNNRGHQKHRCGRCNVLVGGGLGDSVKNGVLGAV